MRPFTREDHRGWPTWKRWHYAAKPASWPKLLVPAALGQALGFAAGGRSLGGLAFGLTFAVLDLIFVVFLNDWGDRHVDALKRRMFPRGCSPKTIPDGILPGPRLLGAGLAAGAAAIGLAVAAAAILDRPALPFAAAGCLALFAAYSLPPLRLNYRGGGELLEMVGVGVALPLLNLYAQRGSLAEGASHALPGFALLSLASALASGLSDERSDRIGGKRTVATALGNRLTRALTAASAYAGVAAWTIAGLGSWPLLFGAAIASYHLHRMRAVSDEAVTDAFAAQGRYKAHLHRAIWWGALAVAGLEIARNLA